MGLDVASGQQESMRPTAPQVQPGVAPETPTFAPEPDKGGLQMGVADAAGQQADRLAGMQAEAAAAQSAAQAAEVDRRTGYDRDMRPEGSSYGDLMNLPDVPAYATPAANSDLYPFPGDEPVPAG